ncbi:helix-turn-helix domain-containing protein [Dissulfurispira sp.]|uniref:helix-turn-helix domain-containing protein n=1 Tax=Dissulfurispira sp. TaxID=2817609 RepID=UPI003FA60764
MSKDAEDMLIKYKWEGNVRELENVMERAITISDDDVVGIEDLPDEITNYKEQLPETINLYPSGMTLFDVERMHIQNVLNSTGGNKSRAARMLGIDYSTLRRKLKSTDIEV